MSADIIDINESDLRKAMNAMIAVSAIIKARFPNLTVNETTILARDIVYAIKATQ